MKGGRNLTYLISGCGQVVAVRDAGIEWTEVFKSCGVIRLPCYLWHNRSVIALRKQQQSQWSGNEMLPVI